MLKKKIILGMLVLGSCIAGITQARNINVDVGESFTIGNDTAYLEDDIGNVYSDEYGNIFGYEIYESYYGTDAGFWGIFWNNGQLAYIYAYNGNSASYTLLRALNYFSGYCEVNYTDNYVANGSNNALNGCSIQSIDNFYSNGLGGPINNIFGYKPDQYHGNDNGYICFGVQSIDKAYCFILPGDSTLQTNSCNYIGNYVPNSIGYDKGDCTQQHAVYYYNNKYNLGDFTDLYGESPFNAGPGTEGGPISCVNIKTQIMLYGAKYNTGMCYTNGYTFSGNQLVQTGKLSIFDIYPSYIDFREALNVYSTYCNPNAPSTQQYCENQMSEYSPYTYQFYNYLKNANSNNEAFGVESEKLYQYCHLQLNFTEEEKRSECVDTVDNYYATGTNEETANGNPFEGVTEWIENNIEIAVPRTGTVFDEFLEGDTRVVGIVDRFGNFKELYHKITGLFKYRNTQEGIIPGYITAMIMIILLLAIFKK